MASKNVIRAVCLDLMGTVLYDPYLEALTASTGLDVTVAHARKDPTCWPDFELGRIDEEEFARRFFLSPEQRFDLDAFHEARRAGYRFLPGMAELIDGLAGGVDRYVASNYPVWIEELRETFDLDRRFDGVWASCHLGARKPDTAFYERLLDKIGQEAGSCLFVDDREANCAAAERVGMRPHVFTGAEDLAARLRREGLPAA